MFRLICACLVATFLSLPSGAKAKEPACPPPKVGEGQEKFVAWLDCTLGELQAVWKEDVIPGILLAKPAFLDLRALDLVYVSGCDFSPRLQDANGDGDLDVVFNTRLLIPQLVTSQAILWYLIAPEGRVTPQAHLSYINEHLLPAVRQDQRLCSREGRTGRFSMVPIASFFAIHPEAYPVFQSLDSPRVRRIGDYVGALPPFAALIHEAGHAALHLDGAQVASVQAREGEADSFAADVFAGNQVPGALGFAYLLLAYDLDRGGASPEIACRIVSLAQRGEGRASPELGPRIQARLSALRRAYADHYAPLCAK